MLGASTAFGAGEAPAAPPRHQPEPIRADETNAVAARLAMAFAERERDTSAPPYKPEGFVDHYPHFPALAAGLSVLGPGAGQIYNGQPERALGYALSWPLLKPWLDSVRDAHARAAKIEGYWLPRPPDGALLRAVRHVVIVQAVVWGLISFSIWSYHSWERRQEQERVRQLRQIALPSAFDEAVMKVGDAKLAALTAYEREVEAYEKANPKMSDAERGERLFRVALESCKARKYAQCQSLMRRVLQLQPAQRDAVRLMAWAKIQVDHPQQRLKMPDMSRYASLEVYEEKLATGLVEPPDQAAPSNNASAPDTSTGAGKAADDKAAQDKAADQPAKPPADGAPSGAPEAKPEASPQPPTTRTP